MKNLGTTIRTIRLSKEQMIRSALAWVLTGVACGVCVPPVQAENPTFTDWTSINTTTNVAVGTLGPATVTLSGGDIYFGIADGSFTRFDRSFFTPPLASSDVVEFIAPNPPSILSYTVSFSSPLTNPRVHLLSLASTLDFGGITLNGLSGQSDFTVSGSTVKGALHDGVPPPNDSNGTIELLGTFSSFTFMAQALGIFTGGGDGIGIQIGADLPPDDDEDGVPNNEDGCPNSDLSPTVVINGCNSKVPNTLFPSGCTISDQLAACATGASNHGQFVGCISHMADHLKKAGAITGQQRGAIQNCAAQANIP